MLRIRSSLGILINYDGKWVNSMYKNCKTKGLLDSDKITIEELRNKKIEDSEYEEESNTTQLDELLFENMQFEDMLHVEVDNVFQDNVEFNDLPS
ncbi:hypothetical protein L3X38_013804 [Prunus dulcis]|uniref:Uncharacterized protein n=1 Tax=Prunus dulcis TaxID=3755 RepID=A0AAD4WP50_PRUDU|nr:hypothetical protein L3X38_013804 [Prunus dulcis]